MAEGFIQPMGERRMEDIGKQYFKDLVWRSFFYPDPIDKKIYKMHDLFHKITQFISTDVCLQMDNERPSCYPSLINIRHLSFCCSNSLSVELKEFPKCKRLRTFLLTYNNGADVGQGTIYLFQKFSMLRVLDLSQGGITELPDLVGCLKHLRYLNLSGNPIKFVPNSIGKLPYLQTLKLINCRELLGFPRNLRNLDNLRHLQFDKNRRMTHMPPGFGELKILQTLSAFVVGQGEGYTIMELKKMAFLRGSLHLLRLENVKDEIEAAEAKLDMKPWLEELELEWTTPRNKHDVEIVLSHIQFHGNLKKLVITNYCGVAFPPRWLNDSARSQLRTIHLQSCQECSLLPVLGNLPFLESLRIEHMPALKRVHFEFFVGFPSLKSLEFRNMLELKEWEGLRDGDMSSLHVLICKDCPSLISLPSLHILSFLTILKIKRCSTLQSLPERMPITLKKLDVRGSTTVEERCEEGGEDWLKLRSIPALKIVSDRSSMNEPTPMEL
ncbi:putative disease resistance protein At3g14460 [Lycium barbarum]|uniref:putative disease resistance protein At3g14460 n=1 Tax=Lycium barbarum TaxID=112863 RepID=UPI00293F203A|nr:putative disease resistance protein At3g14460 [Lycium barbarum]